MHYSRLRGSVKGVVFLWTLAQCPMPGAEPSLLSALRPKLVAPPLTDAEKQVVARQAKLLLQDLFVNRYAKADYYPGLGEAGQAIEAHIQAMNGMDARAFEEGVRKIFNAQRDLHTYFRASPPLNGYFSFLPLTFTRTASLDNFREVRVQSLQKTLFSRFAPGQRIPAIGDELVQYDGRSVLDAVKGAQAHVQGANAWGGFARGVRDLAWRHHRARAVPDRDTVTLTLKAYQPGEDEEDAYTIELPWLVQGEGIKARDEESQTLKEHLALATDELAASYNTFMKCQDSARNAVYPENPSADKALTWGKLHNEHGNFGYIRFHSMSPSTSTEALVKEAHRLLTGELAETAGLILDVRNNPGGQIALADKVVQLFTPEEVKPLTYRLLNTDLNRRIYNESPVGLLEEQFKPLINAAKGSGRLYTDAAPFSSPGEVNRIGQAYYKPIALLTNAFSYSAGDQVACGLQDNSDVLVVGEDPRTGAGGANPLGHRFLLGLGLKDVFEPLPGGRTMQASWRQTLRVGPENAGELMEDLGCLADEDVSLCAEDLVNGCGTQAKKNNEYLAEKV